MAKIEIGGSLDKLEDIATFLEKNHIMFKIVEEPVDGQLRNLPRYRRMMAKYKE